MDPLDDVFAAMRLQSALYSRLIPRAPWGVSFVKSQSIRFGFMVAGSGWLVVEGVQEPVFLQQGEGFIVKPQILFSLRDAPTSPTRWCEEVFADCGGKNARFGGEGEAAEILCGYLTFDASGADPLLSLLPDVVTVPADATRFSAARSHAQPAGAGDAGTESGVTHRNQPSGGRAVCSGDSGALSA
ncbi:cupin domain-containing protein [Rouxiella chamberiensis]|uniref:Cupin domain-containing protein n=1 Tax=Rouxiella chamberiensis TaxID=1513468 RepID=A0ABY7HL24_9GAMM|nr:cupin domain-containing protein [Rouxiella chamberiensis]WAT00064.1 cupin domain-containing protein [Rouxiella chamberiensis]